jgi:putative ubiquitin-RnfH superfamily antitoxin RatB of RatAB toxin-antitoxin module
LARRSDLRETLMIVHVVWATPEVQDIVPVELAPDASVADAVRRSGLVAHYGLDLASLRYARFGVRIDASARLAEGDRVEIVRGLVADPKAVRAARARAKAAAAKAARNGRRTP